MKWDETGPETGVLILMRYLNNLEEYSDYATFETIGTLQGTSHVLNELPEDALQSEAELLTRFRECCVEIVRSDRSPTNVKVTAKTTLRDLPQLAPTAVEVVS